MSHFDVSINQDWVSASHKSYSTATQNKQIQQSRVWDTCLWTPTSKRFVIPGLEIRRSQDRWLVIVQIICSLRMTTWKHATLLMCREGSAQLHRRSTLSKPAPGCKIICPLRKELTTLANRPVQPVLNMHQAFSAVLSRFWTQPPWEDAARNRRYGRRPAARLAKGGRRVAISGGEDLVWR